MWLQSDYSSILQSKCLELCVLPFFKKTSERKTTVFFIVALHIVASKADICCPFSLSHGISLWGVGPEGVQDCRHTPFFSVHCMCREFTGMSAELLLGAPHVPQTLMTSPADWWWVCTKILLSGPILHWYKSTEINVVITINLNWHIYVWKMK